VVGIAADDHAALALRHELITADEIAAGLVVTGNDCSAGGGDQGLPSGLDLPFLGIDCLVAKYIPKALQVFQLRIEPADLIIHPAGHWLSSVRLISINPYIGARHQEDLATTRRGP